VEATDHLLDIVDLSTLYVIGDVLESDAHEIQADLPVTITFADLPEHEFVGRINHVRMKMDMTRRLVQAVVTVENRQGLLRPGMFGRMAIEVAAAKQQILCPTSALVEARRGTMVLRRESEGRFSRQPIEIGMRSPTRVVIQSGLFPGQQVITRGTHLLMAMFPHAVDPVGPSNGGDPVSGPIISNSAQASPSPVEQILAAKATVELPTGQKTVATSLIEGRVARIFASGGQLVQPGEVLAEIESPAFRNLQLELLQAASKRRWTQGKVDRLGPLAAAGATSTRELWQNELDLKTLSQQVASLQRRLTLLGLSDQEVEQLERGQLTIAPGNSGLAGRSAIRSPIAGRVADIGLTLGQIVHAHDILLEIQNTDTVWIKAVVLENAAARIEPGQDAVVTFPSHPNLRVTGTVVRIAPQLVSQERVLPFWIELPNPQGFLRDGMLARVQITVPKQPATAAVRTLPAK
jgi:multidrug efflux pump subunit AcrA (membrane-fusion protein)